METDTDGNRHESTGSSKKPKEPRKSQKTMFIITYGASGPYISPTMLLELSKIEADECHSTKDRALTYTYIHLTRKVRDSAIEKFLVKAKEMHNIVKNEIFGYESIAGSAREKDGDKIQLHPAFKMIVSHYVTKNAAFKPCTDGEPIIKRGLILKATEMDPDRPPSTLEGHTKARIVEYAKVMEKKLKEAKKLESELFSVRAAYIAVSDERSSLRVENAILKRKIQDMEERAT